MAVCAVSLSQRVEYAWHKFMHVSEPGVGVGHLAAEDESIWNDHAPFAILHFLVFWVALETVDLDAVLGLGYD